MPVTMRYEMTSIGLFALLVIGFALGIALIAHRSQLQANSTVTPWKRLMMESGWLVSPAIVAATFSGISSAGSLDKFGSTTPVQSRAASSTLTTATGTQLPSKPSVQSRTRSASFSPAQRPDWIATVRTGDNISERIVLASQQYSSREEARQDLEKQAADLLIQDLQKLRPQSPQSPPWAASPDDLLKYMVKNEYLEAVDHDFGSFVHPMYRIWWQVELSPAVRTEFLPSWRQAVTAGRIRQVGIAASLMALIVSLMAAYRRLEILTRGTHRFSLYIATASAALLVGLILKLTLQSWH